MLAEAKELQLQLGASQNRDGGWPYKLASSSSAQNNTESSIEPSALAVLALRAYDDKASGYEAGLHWLATRQRPDGSWAPKLNVDTSTALSSFALLALLSSQKHHAEVGKAISWTIQQVYTDRPSVGLLLARFLGLPPAHAPGSVPWFPGTAGWVIPTALSIVALSQAARIRGRSEIAGVVRSSQNYLLSRRCVDGGWNHGGTNARSEDAISYPETTGLALLALASNPSDKLTRTLDLAEKFVNKPQSSEGLSWLQMGLRANLRTPGDPPQVPTPRTSCDVALRLLALAQSEGRGCLLVLPEDKA